MHFSPELRDGVAAGRTTLSFRLWSRPKVAATSSDLRRRVEMLRRVRVVRRRRRRGQ